MSTNVYPTTEHGNWGQPPAPKKKAWWKQPLVWVPAIALICGVGIGTGSQPEPVEVVKEVPGPERVVTKTVEKPVASPACIEYINLSEQAFTLSAEAMGYMSDGMMAASEFDVAGIEGAGANLKRVNPEMTALTNPMNIAKSECRSAR